MVQKQSRLYQESVRTIAELTDTTGVDLCAGQAAVRDRSMVAIRADKVARARTYRRILQVCTNSILASASVLYPHYRWKWMFGLLRHLVCLSGLYVQFTALGTVHRAKVCAVVAAHCVAAHCGAALQFRCTPIQKGKVCTLL